MFGIDWIVEYYVGILIRLIKERRSGSWPVTQGTVYNSSTSRISGSHRLHIHPRK